MSGYVVGARTRVTESYEVRRIPACARILDVPLNRHKELAENMRTKLQRLKAAAGAEPVSIRPGTRRHDPVIRSRLRCRRDRRQHSLPDPGSKL